MRFEVMEHRNARCHCERISAQSSRLVNRAYRRHFLHNFGSTAVSGKRQTSTYDFAQGRQVGPYAIQLLRAAVAHTKPGHHFVEYQQRAILLSYLSQALEE